MTEIERLRAARDAALDAAYGANAAYIDANKAYKAALAALAAQTKEQNNE